MTTKNITLILCAMLTVLGTVGCELLPTEENPYYDGQEAGETEIIDSEDPANIDNEMNGDSENVSDPDDATDSIEGETVDDENLYEGHDGQIGEDTEGEDDPIINPNEEQTEGDDPNNEEGEPEQNEGGAGISENPLRGEGEGINIGEENLPDIPPIEVCDGADNDDDGLTDEGLLNDCGVCGPLPEETCNGEDDDCDGQTDEGFNLGEVCYSEGLGACRTEGEYMCTPEGTSECSAQADNPTIEVCDGVDNDCDGEIDEDLGTITCGKGECRRTVNFCVDGETSICVAGQENYEVSGDGLDNNCNDAIDEGSACNQENAEMTCSNNIGICHEGVQRCIHGYWSECIGEGRPTREIEDDLDNDCDGQTDED